MQSVSRRKFLAFIGASSAASLLPRLAWAGPNSWAAGIQLYTVGKALSADTPGTLKQLHDIGYREVESAGTGKASAADFRKMLDDAGLVCPSAHLQFSGTDLEAQFAVANTLGAHYAVSSVLRTFSAAFIKAVTAPSVNGAPPVIPAFEPLGVEGFRKIAAQMNDVGRKTHAAGLQYAYHNHNFEFEKLPDGTPGYDLLLRETDPELVKFEIDCGWMAVAGHDPIAYFHSYPGRFRMLHIKDFKPVAKPVTVLGGPGGPQGSDLGTGFVQYKPIFEAGKAAGIEHIFVEQEEPFKVSQMESAKQNYAYLKRLS